MLLNEIYILARGTEHAWIEKKGCTCSKLCLSPLRRGIINMTNAALSVPWFDLKSLFNVTSFIYGADACVPRLGSFQPTLTTVVVDRMDIC
jgi:hypothetical protein